MALKRLGVLFSCQIILTILAISLVLPPKLYSAITPDREIVPVDAPDTPLWKSYWDAGRDLARQGKYVIAAEYYKELILRKPQIEEAKWEYCKVLFKLEEFDVAAPLLESLIEANPYQDDYIAMAGHVALQKGEYNRAANYLGQVYTRKPEGEQGVNALEGLVEALQQLGKAENAFILMEQLRQRSPKNTILLHKLAKSAYQQGLVEKSTDYYELLLEKSEEDEELLKEIAEMLSTAGKKQSAAMVWRRLLVIDPENIRYHKKMIAFYLDAGQKKEALPHILSVLKNDRYFEPSLLLTTARIYVAELGRSDKALRYYERYLRLVPTDKAAAQELQKARITVAGNLVVIVENDGAEMLWKDLQKVTENRLALFNLMADNLQKADNSQSLIKLLEIIFQNTRDKDKVAVQLSELYAAKSDLEKSYKYLSSVKDTSRFSADYFLKKAKIEKIIGKDVDAFYSLKRAWEIAPGTSGLTSRVLSQAGQLGLLQELFEIGKPLVTSSLTRVNFSLYLNYIDGLRLNGQFSSAEALYSRMLNTDWADENYRRKILLHQAQTLKLMGAQFDSEKTLRTLLVDGGEQQAVVLQLLNNAIETGAIEDGWALFRFYAKDFDGNSWQNKNDLNSQKLFAAYIDLLEAEEEYATAIDEIELYLAQKRSDAEAEQHSRLLERFSKELCGLYIKNGEYQKCLSLLNSPESIAEAYGFALLARNIISGEGKINASSLFDQLNKKSPAPNVVQLFSLAENARSLENESSALAIYKKILELNPSSIRGKIALAEGLRFTGDVENATSIFQTLHKSYPDERYFYLKYLQLEFKRANYDLIHAELTDEKLEFLPIEFKLLKTRTFWAMKQYKKALLAYRELLDPPVISVFKQRLAEKQLDYSWAEEDKQVFWNLFTYKQPDQLEKLNSLTVKSGFLSHIDSAVGEIAADLYDKYRWEKLINSEYLVRKAVEENNYLTAERKYLRNSNKKNRQSAETLKDLARIYERLGDYSKEAEVYNYLEAQGEKTPELEQFIERNKLIRAPSLGMRHENLMRDGREGQINIEKESIGPVFKYNTSITSNLELNYSELQYSQANGEKSRDGRLFDARFSFDFNEKTDIDLGLGYHFLSYGSESTILTDVQINHELDELLSGYMRYQQDVVDDTIESVEQALYSQSITGGLEIEGTNGFNIGAEYRRRWYDNDNTQDRIYFWGSYSIFSEFTTLELKYSYEMFNNRFDGIQDADTAVASEASDNDFIEPIDLPYWSPSEYWQHLITVRFHHLLKQLDVFSQAPSYYSLDFSVGYESSELFTYSGNFDIFLEMSSNFLLKGELLYLASDDYKERKTGISLMYRW